MDNSNEQQVEIPMEIGGDHEKDSKASKSKSETPKEPQKGRPSRASKKGGGKKKSTTTTCKPSDKVTTTTFAAALAKSSSGEKSKLIASSSTAPSIDFSNVVSDSSASNGSSTSSSLVSTDGGVFSASAESSTSSSNLASPSGSSGPSLQFLTPKSSLSAQRKRPVSQSQGRSPLSNLANDPPMSFGASNFTTPKSKSKFKQIQKTSPHLQAAPYNSDYRSPKNVKVTRVKYDMYIISDSITFRRFKNNLGKDVENGCVQVVFEDMSSFTLGVDVTDTEDIATLRTVMAGNKYVTSLGYMKKENNNIYRNRSDTRATLARGPFFEVNESTIANMRGECDAELVSLQQALQTRVNYRVTVEGCVLHIEDKPNDAKWITIYDTTHTRFVLKFWKGESWMVKHVVRDMDIRAYNLRISHYNKKNPHDGTSVVLVSGNSIEESTRVEKICKTAYNVESVIDCVKDDSVYVEGEFIKFDVYTMDANILSNIIGMPICYDIVEDLIVDIRDANGMSYKMEEEEFSDVEEGTNEPVEQAKEVEQKENVEEKENVEASMDISALSLNNTKSNVYLAEFYDTHQVYMSQVLRYTGYITRFLANNK